MSGGCLKHALGSWSSGWSEIFFVLEFWIRKMCRIWSFKKKVTPEQIPKPIKVTKLIQNLSFCSRMAPCPVLSRRANRTSIIESDLLTELKSGKKVDGLELVNRTSNERSLKWTVKMDDCQIERFSKWAICSTIEVKLGPFGQGSWKDRPILIFLRLSFS